MNFRFVSGVSFLAIVLNQAGCASISRNNAEDTTWSVVIAEPVGESKSLEWHLVGSDGQVIHVLGFPIQSCRVPLAETDVESIFSIRQKLRLAPVRPVESEVRPYGIGGIGDRRTQVYFNLGDKHHAFQYSNEANVPNWVATYIDSVSAIVQRLCPAKEFSGSG